MTEVSYITGDQWDRLSRKGAVRFALYCANQYRYLWKNNIHAVKAVRVVKRWLKRKATKKQCKDMIDIFRTSHRCAHTYTLIINALHVCIDQEPTQAIRYNEYLVDNKNIMKAQRKYYNKLLSSKENVSKKKAQLIEIDELEELSHKDQARFALFYCNYLKYQWKKCKHSVEAMRLADLWIEDKVTSQACLEFASNLGYSDMHAEVRDLLYAIADDDCFSFSVFTGANNNSERFIKAQRKYYNELRYVDDIFENLVLKGNI